MSLAATKTLSDSQNALISVYIDTIMENALDAVSALDEQYMKDVCMAHIQDTIDFEDVEKQIQIKCEEITRRELEKLIARMGI